MPDPWFDKLNRKPNNEDWRLSNRELHVSAKSRLACCVQITPELNEMVCVVGENREGEGGDWCGIGSGSHDD